MEIIHIVLGKANPDRMNGVNKVVYQMAVKQAELGTNVAIWGITSDLIVNYNERNFETKLFLKSKNPFALPKKFKNAVINKKDKAIFHIHGGWIPVFYVIAKLLKTHDIPFVFTPHGAYNTIAMNRSFLIKKLYFNLFEKTVVANATKIHCIGKSEIIGLNGLFKNTKTVLLPYGFESNNALLTIQSNNKNIVFGFIGRLDIYTKGLDTLLLAFSLFNNDVANAQLWIVGDSSEKLKLEKQVKQLNLQQVVQLFGSKFGEEKNSILAKMDVFVHPSRNEGLPTSVIEAASFGKPCIVTDATNIGDQITAFNAGITIEKQDVVELYNALKNMYLTWQNPIEYKLVCNNAIDMVNTNYNWPTIITDLNQKLYAI